MEHRDGLNHHAGKPGNKTTWGRWMTDLPYSLVVEATEDPGFFGFYSTELGGFTGIGHSVEDCIHKAMWGMAEHVQLLREHGLLVPAKSPNPTTVIRNEQRQRTT